MIREPMIFAGLTDLAGKLRGKAFPATALPARFRRGVGWTPTNVQITCFDVIADSPYGALGDLLLIPDPQTEVRVDFEDGLPPEHLLLGHVRELDGTPWECCTRYLLEDALERLERVAGLRLVAAFEHEFQLPTAARPGGDAYTYDGYRDQAALLQGLMAALRAAGLEPDTAMKEYGADQYEVTLGPLPALAAADASIVLRTLTAAAAARFEQRATFTPIRDPAGVGNGVHIHLSLSDAGGEPVTYDPDGSGGLSAVAGAFVAGILRDLDALVALTAPSVISYARLTPHRWSAAFNNLGLRDREAAVRICPVTALGGDVARQFNLEYRAADAAASPHLALAAIVHAGVRGIADGLDTPQATSEDLSLLTPAELAQRGYLALPDSLAGALECLRANSALLRCFPDRFAAIYAQHKQAEIAHTATMTEEERYAAYAAVY